MRLVQLSHAILVAVLLLSLGACAAPRAVSKSGRVTPKGEIRVGAAMQLNIATASASLILDGMDDTVDAIAAEDRHVVDESFNNATKAAVASALDHPFGSGFAFGVRYGVWDRIDVGIEKAMGTWAFDAGYQFMGKPGKRALDGPGEDSPMYGSVSLQFSTQKYELPGVFDKLGSVMGFHMERYDFLLPVAFSHSFGPDEKYGAISYGLALGYSMLDYGLEPHELVVVMVDGVEEVVESVSDEKGYLSYGGFFNVKLGYQYVYALLGLALYYQDYGSFQLLDMSEFELAGLTIVPTFGLEARF